MLTHANPRMLIIDEIQPGGTLAKCCLPPRYLGSMAHSDEPFGSKEFSMESAFILAEKPLLEILAQVRSGLPAAMFEQVAATLGLSTSTLAAKLGIARRTVTRKRSNGAPLSSETSEKLLRVARVRNLGRVLFTTDEAVSEWLSKPESALGDIAPLDLLDTDLGAREVENLLRALAYGHFV
jgi:putative toxin-antitoxin system antitoxin component (TIGR02293 family)